MVMFVHFFFFEFEFYFLWIQVMFQYVESVILKWVQVSGCTDVALYHLLDNYHVHRDLLRIKIDI